MKQKFIRFMSGRYGMYGVDHLSWFLLILYTVISVVSSFFPNIWVRLGIRAFAVLLIVFMVFRLLSKNIYSRRKENTVFRKVWDPVKSFFKLQFDRIKDIKKYRYRRCPHCKTVLRLPLPKSKGKNHVVCPKCKERFSVFNLF